MAISLEKIDIDEGARLGVQWLNAPYGVETLRLLGNIVPDDFKTSYEEEVDRLTEMTTDTNVLAWVIKYNATTVGVAEAKLIEFEGLQAPNMALFIGDISMRGKGVGTAALRLVLAELLDMNYSTAYARALTRNLASKAMLQKVGFIADGEPYTDKDGLHWHNYTIILK